MGTPKYNYNLDFFNEDSEELYYFLGFVAADGYISNEAIEIGVNNKDHDLLKKFRDLIVPDKPIYKKEKNNACILKINMKNKIKEIKDFYNMQTSKKHEEIEFPEIPQQYIKDFIRGYVDGDGSIGTTKAYRDNKVYPGIRLRILGNKEFLIQMNEATKLYIDHNTNAVRKKGKENVYEITYNFSTAQKILHWLYDNANIYLERKMERFQELCN